MPERSALVRRVEGVDTAPGARWRRRGGEPAQRTSAPATSARSLGKMLGLLSAGLMLLGAIWHESARAGSLAEQLSEGCSTVDACRQIEAEAARREQSCWLGCSGSEAELRLARSLRYRAEERSAVRE